VFYTTMLCHMVIMHLRRRSCDKTESLVQALNFYVSSKFKLILYALNVFQDMGSSVVMMHCNLWRKKSG